MTPSATLGPYLQRLQHRALIVGVGGLGLCVVGVFLNPGQFFHAYLLAYLFWLGLALGCLAIVMLHHLVRGAWGAVIQRVLEAGTRTLPLMAVLVCDQQASAAWCGAHNRSARRFPPASILVG